MDARTVSSWSSLLVLLLVAGKQHVVNAMETSKDFVTSQCETGLFRLLPRVQPVNYILHLWPEMEKESFQGHVEIELEIGENDSKVELSFRSHSHHYRSIVKDPTKIFMHAENLVITGLKFQDERGLSATGISYDIDNTIIVVELDGVPAEKSRAWLAFDFTGLIQNEPEGLFRSWIAPDKWVLATNLHPFYARRLFPCFDDPEFKATFDLTIDHPIRTTVLSNTRLQKQDLLVFGSQRSTFKRTPRMSSHLLSFTVGEFMQFHPSALHGGMSITIHAPVGWAVDAPQMLQKAVEAYAAAAQFFAGIPQPMQKIDIVAAKSGHHGMKNWGIIFVNPDLWAAGARTAMSNDWRRAVTDLMKEMVSFWLGYLVTMRWWNDLWLMEGLAGYLADELAAKLYPDIEIEVHTLVRSTVSAMKFEDEKGRPIINACLITAKDILASYDSATRTKSVAVLRMIANHLGKEKFNSVTIGFVYLRQFTLLNANEWWTQLSMGLPDPDSFRQMAHEWTHQPGYPIISVSISDGNLVLKQKSSLGVRHGWSVPITYKLHTFPQRDAYLSDQFVLSAKQVTKPLPGGRDLMSTFNWLMINPHYEGYYRVVYSPRLKDALIEAVDRGDMISTDHLQILSDLYSQETKARRMTYLQDLFNSFSRENHAGAMLSFTSILTELHAIGHDLASCKEVTKLLRNYYYRQGGLQEKTDTDEVTQSARREVAYYLEHKLKNPQFLRKIQEFRKQALASS